MRDSGIRLEPARAREESGGEGPRIAAAAEAVPTATHATPPESRHDSDPRVERLQGDAVELIRDLSIADAALARAATLSDCGRFREAFDAHASARSGVRGDEADLAYVLAGISAGRLDEAEAVLAAALAANPNSWRLWFETGRVLQARRRYVDAIAPFDRALELNPSHFHSLNNCGICLVSKGDGAAAETKFRRCLEIEERNPKAWSNLAVALQSQGRPEAALEAIERAQSLLSSTDGELDLFFLKALFLSDLGCMAEAADLLDAHLPPAPNLNAHYLYAHVLLHRGRWAEGWTQNEFRWMLEPLVSLRGRLHVPVWRGQDLRGRSILVRPEQGLGDTLQFIRYVPILKALGATVILQIVARA